MTKWLLSSGKKNLFEIYKLLNLVSVWIIIREGIKKLIGQKLRFFFYNWNRLELNIIFFINCEEDIEKMMSLNKFDFCLSNKVLEWKLYLHRNCIDCASRWMLKSVVRIPSSVHFRFPDLACKRSGWPWWRWLREGGRRKTGHDFRTTLVASFLIEIFYLSSPVNHLSQKVTCKK